MIFYIFVFQNSEVERLRFGLNRQKRSVDKFARLKGESLLKVLNKIVKELQKLRVAVLSSQKNTPRKSKTLKNRKGKSLKNKKKKKGGKRNRKGKGGKKKRQGRNLKKNKKNKKSRKGKKNKKKSKRNKNKRG